MDATFAGRHERAWSMLTAKDQKRTPRARYVQEQRELAQTRAQVAALGAQRWQVRRATVRGDRASVTVTFTGGLGRSEQRFTLRRQANAWRVDYAVSWVPAD